MRTSGAVGLTMAVCALLAARGSRAAEVESMRLAKEGRSRVCVVVEGSPGEIVRAAAEDLRRCLSRAIGAEVALADPAAPAPTPLAIHVATRRGPEVEGLSRDGCLLRTQGRVLLIAGATDVGASNGVYTFLTEQVGVRWLAPDPLYEVIPERPDLALPRLNRKRSPDFRYRMLVGVPGQAGRDWERRNRQDVDDRGIARFGFGHNVHTFLSPEAYGKEHPEYFAMIDGRRKVPLKGGWDSTNPCFTNPAVIAIAAEAATRYFRENPERDTFPVSINDTADHCRCPRCAELDAGLPPGQGGVDAFSGSYFHFVAEVAKRVARTNPGKYVGCFPYWPVYPLPPRMPRLPNNVVIQLTQDSGQQHDARYRRAERAHWVAWAGKVSTIGRYDYYDLGWLTPRCFPHLAAADIKFLRAHGCDGFYCGIAPNWSVLGPQVYVAARLLWDASLNPDRLLDDYCGALFGPAAPEMRRFYAVLERYWMQPRPARWFEGLAGITTELTIVNGPLIEEARQCLARARRAVSGVALRRVEDVEARFRLPYLLVKMQAEARALAERPVQSRADLDALAGDIVAVLALMPEARATYARDWQPDPNYSASYYGPESVRGRLRDWAHERDRWLRTAVGRATSFVATLPSGERDAAWQSFRAALLAADPALGAAALARDLRAEFDRSDAADHDGRGGSESLNTNGELAWGESYRLIAYMEMYRATDDRDYLRRLVAHFDRVLGNRDDALGKVDAYAGRPLAGWGSERYSDGKWHAWIVHTGMILAGPAEFVRVVGSEAALRGEFGAKAAEYSARIAESIGDADAAWRTGPDPDEGWYFGAHPGKLLPLNQQNALGVVLLEMYRATGNPAYRDKVERLARFFHRRLRYPHSDYYDWAYWPGEHDDGRGSEDISHAGINVQFAAECAADGIVFTRSDAVRLARTWLQMVRRPDGTWAGTVGGTGDGAPYMPFSAGNWLVLSPLIPDHLAARLYGDALGAFVEQPTRGPGELLGIARLLRLAQPSSAPRGGRS